MANIKRFWAKSAPTHDVRTLAGCWADFHDRLNSGQIASDPSVEVVIAAPSISAAIDAACASRGKDGKMWNHQSKVPAVARENLAQKLKARAYGKSIRGLHGTGAPVRSFDELYQLILSFNIHGIGELTAYDVTMRLGKRLGFEPEVVYVHTGVAMGLKACGISTRGKKVLTRAELPRFLGAQKDLDRVEDFLCSYRSVFAGLPPEELMP